MRKMLLKITTKDKMVKAVVTEVKEKKPAVC